MVHSSMRLDIVMVASDNFVAEVVESETPVLFACFQAGDYSDSGQLELAQVSEKFSGALKVCVANKESLGVINEVCKIEGTPTFLIYKNGEEVGRLLGRWDEFLLSDFISQALFSDNEDA